MPAYQKEPRDRTTSPQEQPLSPASETLAASLDCPQFADDNAATQFRVRILVVDDDLSIRETAKLILESGGFEVVTAADGVEGLQSLSKSLPDLIISDLNMPRMSGREFLAVVRQRFPHIATIAMSGGYPSCEMPIGILADVFLQKGIYTIKDLPHEVRKLLHASPRRSQKVRVT